MNILLWLLACSWADLDDCRVTDPEHCSVFLPEGLACGLVHEQLDGHPGSSCEGFDPAGTPEDGSGTSCPSGYRHESVPDHESDSGWHLCLAEGNLSSSSGDLAEVPLGAACGFSTVGTGGSDASCMGEVPSEGSCPAGFTLRYTLDVYGDVEDEGGTAAMGAHLDTWCELTESGCAWGECPQPPDVVCGLHGEGFLRNTDEAWIRLILDFDELSPALAAILEADLADGSIETPTCQGAEAGECPEGMERACTGEWIGSEDRIDPESLCWCTAPEAVREAPAR